MMRKQIVAVVFATSIVAGIGAGVLASALASEDPAAATDEPSATPTRTSATPDPTKATSTPKPTGGPEMPTEAADFVIAPGAIGPVAVGMSRAEALATGLFVTNDSANPDVCGPSPLAWKPHWRTTFDVYTVGNGEITTLGVFAKAPRTADGVGVGSTLAEVRATLEDKEPVAAGYGQSGLFDYDGESGRWIGYLFDDATGELTDDSTVTFVEVTKGEQPSLMRDGC